MMHWKVLLECTLFWSGGLKYTQPEMTEKIYQGALVSVVLKGQFNKIINELFTQKMKFLSSFTHTHVTVKNFFLCKKTF